MSQFYTKDIKDGNGEPLKVVWEYEEQFNLTAPEEFFLRRIVPELEEKTSFNIWQDRVANRFGFIMLNYKYQRLCFVRYGDPCTGVWWGVSFPCFVNYVLAEWAGEPIKLYRDEPPIKPFRFYCRLYSNYNHSYYIETSAEAALSRDFKLYPPTPAELKVWRALRGTKSPAKADTHDKILFLVEYAKRIGTATQLTFNDFKNITL